MFVFGASKVFSGPYFPAFGLSTEIYTKSPHSVRMQENTNQKKVCVWTLHAVSKLPYNLSFLS